MKNFNLIEMVKAMKEHKLRHMWRYAAMMALLLTLACGQMWGEDITITPTYSNNYTIMPYGLVSVKGSVKANSSGVYSAGSNGASYTLDFITTKSDMYIKSVTFNSVSNGTLSSDDGTITSSVLTVSGSKDSVRVTMTSDSGKKGSLKITNIVVNTSSNDVETLTAFSVSTGTVSATAKMGGSSITSAVSITTTGSASDGKLSIPNNGTITFTSSNNITYIAFFNPDNKILQSSQFQVNSTKLATGAWSGSAKSVEVSNKTGAARDISHIWVITEAAPAKAYTVTAATSTGDNSLGTVSATASSLDATETTTITATPATGYKVTNWAVSGTGASISPSGASNSNTTTLTMGTANATVTATFGPKSYTVTLNNQSATTAGTENVPTTYNSNTNLTSAITKPTKTGYVFAGYFTATNGGGVQLIDAAGNWIASAGGGSTYMDGSKNWKNDGNLTLYACWMEYASTFDIKAYVQSNLSSGSTTKTFTILGTNKLLYSLSGNTELDNSSDASNAYDGLKFKNNGDHILFLVQANYALKLYFGYTDTKPKISINGGAESNVDVSSTGSKTADQEVDFGSETYDRLIKIRTVTSSTVVLQKIEITAVVATCPDAWSFHSKNSSSEWRDPICMELDGDGDFYISEETAINVGDVSYKVGYQGVDEAKTTETDWQWMPMGPARNWTVGAHPTASNAGGALGYFYIHSSYTDNNRYIGFFPSSYMLRQGSGESWSNTTFNPASSAYGETVWTTPVQKYTASNAADYMYTALGTGNGGAVGCAMSTAMRPIYLKLHSDWKASSPKFYIYYFKNGTDKNGWSGLMQAVSGTGGDDLVGWIPEGDWDRVQFVRFNPGDAVASWDGNVWNSTYAITLDSEKNYYVLEAQGKGGALDWYGHWDLYHNGFYRIWVDNASTNFALHYVPQYVLEYDNNGGSGSIDPQSVALDADPNTVTVKAATGFTAPTGKHFVNWNTAPGGGGTSYDPSDSYSLTADATLYAQWAWNTYDVSTSFTQVSVKTGTTGTGAATHGSAYTVTLQGETGYNLPTTVTVTIGGSPATLTTDYTWNSSTGVLTVLAAKVTGNISISATGVAKTTAITLEAGEGGTDGSATATYGTSTITGYEAATRTGYTLGNYYKDAGGYNILTKAGTLNSGDKGSLIVGGNWASADAAVTLYAQWTAIEYTLSYDLAGGSVASPNPTSYTIESSAITLNNPTKTGYTFAGWTGTGLAEATTTVTIAAGSTGNRSYTATWTAIVPSSVSLNKTSTTITVGGTETLTATISPAVVADNTITWSTSDADVATVDGGVVTAVAAGTATITATTVNDKAATCAVTVAPAVTYTVTYVYNGADGGSRPESATGSSVSLPNPTKTGYTLQGWYTSSGSLAGAATATYNPTSDITLYALWREDECSGGGGGSTTIFSISGMSWSAYSAENGTITIYPTGTPDETYTATLVGASTVSVVNTNSDGKSKSMLGANSIKIGGNAVSMRFTLTSGTLQNGDVISFTNSGSNQLSFTTTAERSTTPATTSDTYTITKGDGLAGSSSLYVWRSTSSSTEFTEFTITRAGGSGTCYYVTYNGNGADGGFTKDEASHPSGSNVTVASNSFTNTGYTFTGWKTEPSGGTSYAAGGTISGISGNMTLYAQWEEEEDETTYYLVTSIAQLNATDTYIIANSAGTAVMSTTIADTDKNPDDITSGFSVDGSTLTVTSASANLFKLTSATNGWLFKGGNGSGNYLSSDGTPDADLWYNTSSTPPNNTGEWAVSFSEGIATMKLGKADETTYHIYYDATNTKFIQSTTASNIKIYTSNSTPVYTVTYANGGATSGSVPVDVSSPYEENAEVTVLGNTGSLAKNGYTFGGWSNGVTTYTAGNTFSMPATNVTLTAVWTPNTYDITYNLNGASWAGGYSAPANYTVGTGATLPVAGNMTNTGYTFGGWYDNSGLTGSSISAISSSDYGNKEFWAKWTENTYTVTYSANGGTGDAMSNTVGHYVTLSANTYTNSGYIFAGWNTATDGSGASYSEGEEIELKANLDLYAIWASDYDITWDDSPKLSGVAAKPNLGGGNYTITTSVATWTGSLTTSMISAETSGVTITGVSVNNSASPKTITATFNVGASVVGDKISFTLDVPAYGSYSAKSDTKDFDIDRCTGSSSGSDGVLFSAEFKDSGLGTSDICTAANTPYTFTTAELKAAPTGGSIKASTTSTLSHMKFATNAISIAGSDGVIQIDLSNAIATNDLFTYVNVNSSNSSAYLRHTSPTTTTDQIALTVYNSKEAKVRLTSGFNGKTTLYIVRNNKDFKLHKAAVIRPAFLMLLRDDTPTSDTNLEGTDQELTTENYLTTINGGRAYYTSPSSGNLKIKRSSSKNYINFNNAAGYVKIVLNEALQEDDVIGFDSYNTNNLALTTTATRSTSIVTTNQLYTVDASSDLKGKSTFYLWQYGGSSDFLRGLQIARSGVAGGGGGTDKITTTLTWDTDLSGGVAAETGDADFTHTVTQDKNSLGAITYSSNNTSVATVNASGKVHIVGAGNATITATMAASGCYKEATTTYAITVTDNCADVAGTISTEDLGCLGVRLTVTGHTAAAGVEYQWYKDGGAIGGATSDNYTATTAGEYYVVVTNTGAGHCEKASTNTITLEDSEAATASKIVNSWYVKNGRRTPDIALVQTENATDFTVTSGGSPITTFAGCAFYLGTDGIIYLKGQQEDDSAPTGLTSGDETLKFTAIACGGNSDELSITIHKQAETDRPSVAFVVDGTKGGDFDEEEENHSVNTELYQFLNYNLSTNPTGKFDLTGQNVYSTVDEQAIREHYSQFDAILITDDPSTDTKSGKKSYVDAFGTMIDVRPILTMEAFVSKWGNWKAKGIDGNPESPNPRQYKMKLQCKDHAIFKGLSVGTNVETETIDGVVYWTVTMVDNTKSPYSGVADGTDTDTKPALQGFSADDVSSLLLLGEISEGSLYAGVERQEETAARLMLLGLNAKALPNALTPEGKKVIENALKYLIETDLEKVDDCSNYFTGATDKDWNKDSNWSKGHVPNSPNVRVRILSECVINSGTYKVAEVDIATSGKSLNKAGEMTGKLTINAGAALIVGGKIRTAKAPYFNTGDLMPTTVNDLIINTDEDNQAALIFDNEDGDTKATVNLYSLGRKISSTYQYQYLAVPMSYIDVNPAFAGTGIYTYVWKEASGWERRGYYDGIEAFEGVGITTKFADARTYQMKGTLASTETQEIALTNDKNGQNMIGNSWTAPIQISELDEDNTASEITKTVYIYCTGNGNTLSGDKTETAGQWLAIPFSAAGFEEWDGLKVIPAMQTFNINVTGTSTLTLDYDKVVRGGTTDLNEKLRAPKRSAAHEGVELMRIRVEDSQTHTDLYLFKGERFSDEFDNGWEAEYLNGDGRSAKLYAQTEIGKMAVVATDELEGTVLGFEPGKETEYTFTFGGEGMGYYLNDLKLKKSTWINAGETYSFIYEEGDINRFIISTTPITTIMTGCESVGAEAAKVRKVIIDDKVYIIRGGRIYSVDGQMVK